MQRSAYCLFETPLGWCGIIWRESPDLLVVTALQLPEATQAMTEARITQQGEQRIDTPPPAIAGLVDRINRHFGGEPQDFRDVAVELPNAGAFAQRVYAATRNILAGQTASYGELARLLDKPGAARAIGQALGRNPIPLIIPCHRITAAGGKPGGFTAPGGLATKARLLKIEGVDLGFRQQ